MSASLIPGFCGTAGGNALRSRSRWQKRSRNSTTPTMREGSKESSSTRALGKPCGVGRISAGNSGHHMTGHKMNPKAGCVRVARLLVAKVPMGLVVGMLCSAGALGQAQVASDPAEPVSGKPHAKKVVVRPTGRIARASVDEKGMRSLISGLVTCGTRLTLASWDDPKRGPGCARDRIVERLNTISKETGGKLQVTVDKFEMTSERTHNQPAPLE